ncbi:hypothetical protein Bbelb_273960 [Branchiostoma belcheri]|nr:hypothetical protein Bbelb_273960 [Branchiostoma belcheri]
MTSAEKRRGGMESTRRVAIIGAGVSGLACIKACLEEGLEPVCFEQHDELGGVWYYTDEPRPNQGATIYKSLVSNRTKEMMAFSDFPQPKEAPPFLPYTQVHSYLREFADKFQLMKYIQFGVQVQHIWRAEDYTTSGKWMVRTAPVAADNNKNTCPQTSLFDRVMVCSGHFSKPFVPKVPGLEEFTGVVVHSRDYNGAESFKGRKVMVVGGANSAGDVAAEVAQVASVVYLSVRDGIWLVPRLAQGGKPRDFFIQRARLNLPEWLKRILLRRQCNACVDHANYGLQLEGCKDPIYGSTMINDEMAFRLATGKVVTRPVVERFTRTGVVFSDGSKIDHLDAVVFATGYNVAIPFIESDILPRDVGDLELYKMMFPARLPHSTLAVIGCVGTIGPIFPVLEIQSRWAARVFSGHCKLPDPPSMQEWLRSNREKCRSKIGRVSLMVCTLPYCEDIAQEIGVRPSFWQLLPRDPYLAYLVYFGPAFPTHYRLVGPHRWAGAARHVKLAVDNTYSATRKSEHKPEHCFSSKVTIVKVMFTSLCVIALGIVIGISY